MERDTEQLSAQQDSDYELTYASWLRENDHLSALYPELPENYFKDKGDVLTPVRWRPKVMPYISRTDLNHGDADAKPKYAWEIGIKGSF